MKSWRKCIIKFQYTARQIVNYVYYNDFVESKKKKKMMKTNRKNEKNKLNKLYISNWHSIFVTISVKEHEVKVKKWKKVQKIGDSCASEEEKNKLDCINELLKKLQKINFNDFWILNLHLLIWLFFNINDITRINVDDEISSEINKIKINNKCEKWING